MAVYTRRQYAGNSVATTTTGAISTSDTTVSIVSTTGWPSTAGVPFHVVIDPGTSTEEKMLCTLSGSALTLVRASDGTSASSHPIGATIYPVFTATDANEANAVASMMTTKGDLLVTTGTLYNRLPVGANRQQLTADSTATNGVKWQYEGELGAPNAQTGTTYTFALTDSATLVTFDNAASITATIPTNAAVAFPTGTQINFMQLGAGQVTPSGAGVTVYAQGSKTKTFGQYSIATLVKIATNTWVLCGNII